MTLAGRLLLFLTLILCSVSVPALAEVENAPGANLEVSLITYGPGDIYWERFGHDAIELRDTVSGEEVDFNYGMFNFDEKNFFLNFARGRMHYLMDAEPTTDEEDYYRQVGRSITRQRLALTPDQAAALRDFLFWNLRPENVGYNYDYYADNCTTRVRDALDRALGGIIKTRLTAIPGGMTYRQQTVRLMSAQPWLMLIMDLGLGPYADQPLSAWKESFLPETLQNNIRAIAIDDGHGGTHPLVQNEDVLSPNRLDVPPNTAPDLRMPLGIAGLIFAALIVIAWRSAKLAFALLGSLFLIFAGLSGLLMLILWTLTEHHSAWANANLLLFNPLAFVLIGSLWCARRRLQPSRLANGVLMAQLAALLVALLLHLLPGVVQQNQPWILFALPCWLALAWSLRQSNVSS
jgi:thiamine transporter ThiT